MVAAVRVRRRRGIHVLMGTLALVAGCSTAQRAEVRGTVRDRATGRVIAGARVVGADGSLAETDADGRFRLYVIGSHADVRVSASGHSSEHLAIEGLDTVVALAPIDPSWGAFDDESAHVVSFLEETWSVDGGALDASSAHACPSAPFAQADSSTCAGCHASEAAAIRGTDGDRVGAHDALGNGCLSCHAGEARASCERCHGDGAGAVRTQIAGFFALATSSALDEEAHGTRFEIRSTIDVESEATISTWARALARDRSGGAHDPRTAAAVGRALR
jgi:hypothetical protein